MAPRTRGSQAPTPTPAPGLAAAASAPASRVYRSSNPPQQVRFPARKKSIKTYGRATVRALRQQTLTQLDYVVPMSTPSFADNDDDEEENERVDKTRPYKRRRTMGDAPSST